MGVCNKTLNAESERYEEIPQEKMFNPNLY